MEITQNEQDLFFKYYRVVTKVGGLPVQIYLCSSLFFAHILFFSFFYGLDLQVESLTSLQQCLTEGFIASIIIRPQSHASGICVYTLCS